MEEAEAPTRYWCHMCSQTVNPILEIESVKCPICQGGFVEEMASSPPPRNDSSLEFEFGGSDSDRALSLWAPILLGMMGSQQRRRLRIRRMGFEDGGNDHDDGGGDDDEDDGYESNRRHQDREGEGEGEGAIDRELDAIARRRRSSAAILQLLQGMRAGILSEAGGESETDQQRRSTERDNERERERVVLINPFNQTIILQGSYDTSNDSISRAPIGSLGDYFIGPGLDLLLQHLSENDPNRYGTPPAQKEAIEALPTVKIEETLQCSVCLDDCEIGDEVKEMPCKHKFHSKCILPWLELHSSCPICRRQLPFDESKLDSEGSRNDTNNDADNHGDDRNERGSQFSVPLPWPFSSLFSSSTTSISGPSSNANPSTSHQDQN